LPSKLQIFLNLPQLTIALIWFPLITYWLTTYCPIRQRLSIAIDRSQGGVSICSGSHKFGCYRAIPLYWCLLPKFKNSNLSEQALALQQILPLFKEYKIIVLGGSKFCSVDLENWPETMGVFFFIETEKNYCLETETLNWQRLDQLGIIPGISLYF